MQNYIEVTENNETKYREMNRFIPILHDMFTQLKNKIALSSKDDKRYIIPGGYHTLEWVYKDIEILEIKADCKIDTVIVLPSGLLFLSVFLN